MTLLQIVLPRWWEFCRRQKFHLSHPLLNRMLSSLQSLGSRKDWTEEYLKGIIKSLLEKNPKEEYRCLLNLLEGNLLKLTAPSPALHSYSPPDWKIKFRSLQSTSDGLIPEDMEIDNQPWDFLAVLTHQSLVQSWSREPVFNRAHWEQYLFESNDDAVHLLIRLFWARLFAGHELILQDEEKLIRRLLGCYPDFFQAMADAWRILGWKMTPELKIRQLFLNAESWEELKEALQHPGILQDLIDPHIFHGSFETYHLDELAYHSADPAIRETAVLLLLTLDGEEYSYLWDLLLASDACDWIDKSVLLSFTYLGQEDQIKKLK